MSSIPSPQLSAIEQYLFIDNRPSHPLDFFYRLKFEGSLDEARLFNAYCLALQQHPLLRSVVVTRGRRYEWSICEDSPKFEVVQADAGLRNLYPPAIDLAREPGSRLYVCVGSQETTLLFQFHHSTTDGLGAMGFVNDVMVTYINSHLSGQFAPARDINRLGERHGCGYHSSPLLQRIRKQLYALYVSKDFLGCRVSPLVDHRPEVAKPRTSDDAFRDIHQKLTVNETAAIKRIAREHNVSANTWLIRDAFVALEKIRQEYDGYNAKDYVRIAVPGNLRSTQSNDGFPAANFFSMTFPARNSHQVADANSLLESIHKEVRAARTHFYFATFILGLKMLRLIPGGLERTLKADKCQTSLLLTNVGKAFYAFPELNDENEVVLADAKLQTVELVAPMRPYQSIALATLEYAGQQTITMSYDPRIHNDAEAEGILQAYIDQLRSQL